MSRELPRGCAKPRWSCAGCMAGTQCGVPWGIARAALSSSPCQEASLGSSGVLLASKRGCFRKWGGLGVLLSRAGGRGSAPSRAVCPVGAASIRMGPGSEGPSPTWECPCCLCSSSPCLTWPPAPPRWAEPLATLISPWKRSQEGGSLWGAVGPVGDPIVPALGSGELSSQLLTHV